MLKMLPTIWPRKIESTLLKLLLTCLTALSLSSCAGLKKFPTDYVYEVDLHRQICGKYKIVDKERMLFEHDSDLPIMSCDGVFGFSTVDTPKVMDWGRDAIDYGKKCKVPAE